MRERLFAFQRWPAFERSVISGFEVGVIGSDAKERIKVESQVGLVFEKNPDCTSVMERRDFDSFNDLAPDDREGVWFAPLAGTCRLRVSQFRLLTGELVRAAFVLITRRSPTPVVAYARLGDNKKRAKSPVTARKSIAETSMCVKYILAPCHPENKGLIVRHPGVSRHAAS